MLKKKSNENVKKNGPAINEKIPGGRITLIDAEGANQGIVNKYEAIEQAQLIGFDLVMLTESGPDGVPLVKVMDLGKSLYEKKKKATEAKKKQKVIKIKELKIRPTIGDHDLQIKIKQGVDFLNSGKRIKLTLVFRGREIASRNEVGPELFQKVEKALQEADIQNLSSENESKMGKIWSKVYFIKNS